MGTAGDTGVEGQRDGSQAAQFSNRSLERARDAGESRKTVIVAICANGAIAVAKLFGGLVSGSAGMLAEAAHSVADTTNQGFLLVSIQLAGRKPTPERPFGYGGERYLWTFMAAIGMFLAGAVFAVGFGIYELMRHEGETSGFAIAYAVLAAALVAEGSSWVRAFRQTRAEARDRGQSILRYARETRDPNVKMVLFEDTAALAGLLIAALGIGLNAITGSKFWDPMASILIGVLLIFVAFWLGRDARHLLLGSSATPEERASIEDIIESYDEVIGTKELLTIVLAPKALLVAARIDLRDDLDAARVETVSSEIERSIRDALPDVTEVFLDATPPRGRGDHPQPRPGVPPSTAIEASAWRSADSNPVADPS
jgi:cation diffusion facilitator family transporter